MGSMKSLAIDKLNMAQTRFKAVTRTRLLVATPPVVTLPIGEMNELLDTQLHVCEGLKVCYICGRLLRLESEEYLTLENRYDRLLSTTEEDL
jgi:hypothetical protein